jgi:hypothetical protein
LNSTRKTVLVLDPTYQALAIVRSVAKLGLSVAVGLPPGTYPVAMSRYVDEVWKHPDVSDVDAFCAALQSFLLPNQSLACQSHYFAPVETRLPQTIWLSGPA